MNRLFLLLFGLVTFAAHAQVPDYAPTEGLVAWYPFNGNANDESGNAANGTIHGTTPTEDRNGVSSAAFHFDGQSWVSASPLGLPDANTPRSVSAWLNPSTVAGSFTLTAVAYGAPSSSSAFMVGLYNQGIAVQGWADDFGTEVDYSADEWMHVVCTYAASSIKIYQNGVLIEEGENTTWNTMDGPLILGSRVDLANSYFEGSIDDVGIWNRALDPTEVVALYNSVTSVPGCTDIAACNYNEDANEDDGTCTYPPFGLADCEAGSALCGEGTIWVASIQACLGCNDCPSDLDGDGIVGVNDLLSLLSDFGTECPPDVAEWACGDPVSYHGFDYATVQIGEQCWFAENLRNISYANGDAIPGELTNAEWSSTNSGAQAIYSNDASNLAVYGRRYNWHAVDDARGLCPTGWHVPTDGEYLTLEMALGMSESEAYSTEWRGTDQGTQMKSSPADNPAWEGTNTSGFSALAGGYRYADGHFDNAGDLGYFWSSSSNGSNSWYRTLNSGESEVRRYSNLRRHGFSVRCVED